MNLPANGICARKKFQRFVCAHPSDAITSKNGSQARRKKHLRQGDFVDPYKLPLIQVGPPISIRPSGPTPKKRPLGLMALATTGMLPESRPAKNRSNQRSRIWTKRTKAIGGHAGLPVIIGFGLMSFWPRGNRKEL